MSTGTPAYELMEIAAAGTFGTVCIVRDLDRGVLIALKVLKAAHLDRPRVIARTQDEAAMLSQIHHPGIVRVAGFRMVEDRPLIAMEWVRGLSFEKILEHHRDGLPLPEALEVIKRATLALGAAYHATPMSGGPPMHIIHRDMKPSNLLLSVDGEVKLVDFGIARGDFEGKQAQTMSMVLGARGYLAPERLDGHDDKASCDVFSLGVMLYELVTGRHMMLSVHREYHDQALRQHLASLSLPGVPEATILSLKQVISRMCAYNEGDRPDHEHLVGELDRLQVRVGTAPDLPRWSKKSVYPMFRDRPQVRPIDHPAYPQLAFLERQARMVKFPAPPDVDQEIRFFLKRPGWTSDLEALEMILVKNPHWSADPFLERLPSGSRSWWQFWGGKEVDLQEVAVILPLLAARPTLAVRQRVEPLLRHPDPDISHAARTLLDRIHG